MIRGRLAARFDRRGQARKARLAPSFGTGERVAGIVTKAIGTS